MAVPAGFFDLELLAGGWAAAEFVDQAGFDEDFGAEDQSVGAVVTKPADTMRIATTTMPYRHVVSGLTSAMAGNVVRWEWSVPGIGSDTGIVALFPLPAGTHDVSLTTKDDLGNTSTVVDQVVVTAFAGEEHYVDFTLGVDVGTGAGAGQIGAPWKTLQYALANANWGSIGQNNPGRVFLKRGETWPLVLDFAAGATNGPFYIEDYGAGAKPKITASTTTVQFFINTQVAFGYSWRFLNINFVGLAADNTHSDWMMVQRPGCFFIDCDMYNGRYFASDQEEMVVWDGCTFQHNAGSCIYVSGRFIAIVDCAFDNFGANAAFQSNAVYVNGNDAADVDCHDLLIRNAQMDSEGYESSAGIVVRQCNGGWIVGCYARKTKSGYEIGGDDGGGVPDILPARNIWLVNSRTTEPGDNTGGGKEDSAYGMVWWWSDNCYAINCVFDHITPAPTVGNGAIVVANGAATSAWPTAGTVHVYNCVFYENTVFEVRNIEITNATLHFKNNIIYRSTTTPPTTNYGIARWANDAGAQVYRENLHFDFNTYYWIGRTAAGDSVFSHNAATPNRTWTQWQTSAVLDGVAHVGQDTNSTFDADPLFSDPASLDWRLLAGSPAIDTGVIVHQAWTDRDGTTRPFAGPYDIGAYEFTPAGGGGGGGGGARWDMGVYAYGRRQRHRMMAS